MYDPTHMTSLKRKTKAAATIAPSITIFHTEILMIKVDSILFSQVKKISKSIFLVKISVHKDIVSVENTNTDT